MACRAVILSKDNGQVELNKNQLAAAVVVAKYFPELGARICSAEGIHKASAKPKCERFCPEGKTRATFFN